MKIFLLLVGTMILSSCATKVHVDTLFTNATFYTVDQSFSKCTNMATDKGKIIAIDSVDLLERYEPDTIIDLNGKFVYPGFNDAHCHFYGYALDLNKIWLTGTTSFEEILDTLKSNRNRLYMGWLFGRGWDQNDWQNKSFPTKQKLDELFPDVPVFLMRIDGHAALVNQMALDLAGITDTTLVNGGELIKENGHLTGLLIDNAIPLVQSKIQEISNAERIQSLSIAQQNCFKLGITALSDAGLESEVAEFIDSLQQKNILKFRYNVMLIYNNKNVDYARKKGLYRTDKLSINSFKIYADGALGSRGACLRVSYLDQPNHFGNLLMGIDELKIAIQSAYRLNYQMNIHCIGDSANHLLLEMYRSCLKDKNNRRWRIEHAQIVSPEDVHIFKDYSIIPSVQPAHATSDMYWAKDRVGEVRIKHAYSYKSLLNSAGLLALGSDFPVEHLNPLFGYYAAVTRKDQHSFPDEGFNIENTISREDALRGMTIWPAYASFNEKYFGSLEVGKFADFVVLNEDLLTTNANKLFKIKVLETYINAKNVIE